MKKTGNFENLGLDRNFRLL